MGKAPGQKKLQVVFIRKFDGKMLTEGGRILTQIKGNIQHPPLEYLYQFGLGVGSQLIMQASYGVFHRPENIVLHKIGGEPLCPVCFPVPQFKKAASLVAEHGGFNDKEPRQMRSEERRVGKE